MNTHSRMNVTQNLGSIVRRQRNRLGLSLADLAAKSGVSISHLGRIENAQRYPSTKVLAINNRITNITNILNSVLIENLTTNV